MDTIVTDLGVIEPDPAPPVGPAVETGVWFGLPEADYHAIPALSSSGMKWLAISPMDFWARCRWLNPAYEADDDTEAQELGSAYHARILEGRDVFYQRYAAALDAEDFPDALRTVEQIRDALREREMKVSGNKGELVERLLDADPSIDIWDAMVEDHAERHRGKTMISARAVSRIEIAAAMIERHPDLSRCFQGGAAELTVVWHDPETGTPCKARLDYVKARMVCDLKTFSNPLGKTIDNAIYGAIAARGYHVQAAHYLSAVPFIRRFTAEGRVFGDGDRDLLRRLTDSPSWVWVFQQTGIAPLARGKVFPAGMVRGIGEAAARDAKHRYAECMRVFGKDPWIDTAPLEALDDTGFPAWIGQ